MAGQQGQPKNDYEEDVKLWIFLGAFIGLLVILYLIRYELNIIAGIIAWAHIYPYAALARHVPLVTEIPYLGSAIFVQADMGMRFLEQGAYADILPENRILLFSIAGKCALPFYLPIMLWAGMFGSNFRPDVQYKTAYSLDQMISLQSDNWHTSKLSRQINPLKSEEISTLWIAKLKLKGEKKNTSQAKFLKPMRLAAPVQQAPKPQSWHRAMRPEEWLVAHGVVEDRNEVKLAQDNGWEYPSLPLEARDQWSNVDIETAEEIFAEQLRVPWQGFGPLRPSHKALIAVMALFRDYQIDKGNDLLADLGTLYEFGAKTPGIMDKSITNEEGLLNRIEGVLKSKAGQNLKAFADKHAWVETAFPTMLHYARKDRGVLPTAAFLWLKSEDRNLWYILNSVGSDAVMVESAGAMSHHRAESQIGTPLRKPNVYQAARALVEDYLDVTPERTLMKSIKKERSMTPTDRLNKIMLENQSTANQISLKKE